MNKPFLYSVEREYDSTIEDLWKAWADPAALRIWYSPTDLKVAEGSVENVAEVGGIWTVGVDVPEYKFVAYFYGWYTEVEPLAKLVHTMHYTQSAEEFEARVPSELAHTVVVDFEARGSKSWVKFSQYGELPEGQAPQAQAGMESYFDNLGKFLA
ncbi:MAG: hypothetical protein RL530_26 [Actinomycetota bacterium]